MGSQEIIKETFFISHGTPRMTIEASKPARKFLESWRDKIYFKKPKAILVISAHWETDFPSVNAVDINDTIYDFYGFPAPMYQVFLSLPIHISILNLVFSVYRQAQILNAVHI